jgi:hypothetical protein
LRADVEAVEPLGFSDDFPRRVAGALFGLGRGALLERVEGSLAEDSASRNPLGLEGDSTWVDAGLDEEADDGLFFEGRETVEERL